MVDAQIPDDLLYTDNHCWIKLEEGTAIIGITHKAQKDLGDVVFIELAEQGSSCDVGDEICSIESIKTTSEVNAALSGRIDELNESLEKKPELLNQDPYGLGWIARIRYTDPSELEDLLSPDDYTRLVDEGE